MDRADRQPGQVGHRGLTVEIAIEGVACLQRDLLARLDLDHRRHVRMPAVMAGIRFLVEVLAAIDGDALGRRAHFSGCHSTWSSLVIRCAETVNTRQLRDTSFGYRT